ncbi:efflux RND transporter periplasmic adaptor subunit [Streptosporangium sp. NPDC049078]|uniref:efflux RND transporter periplasmic adaptor subunit n=1 Tax=Streptosporangium sp. NPDC049078 TaxID=3155767 RepID=UPI00342CA3CB
MRPTHLPKRLRAGGLALAALVLVGAGALVALDGGSDEAPRTEPVSARRGTVTAAVSAAGNTVDDGTRELAFGGSGTVTKVYVKAGDRVGKGDVLARIGPEPARERHAAAKARLAAAEEALDTAESTPESTGTTGTGTGQQSGGQDGERTGGRAGAEQPGDQTSDQAGADRSGGQTGTDRSGDRTGSDRSGPATRTGCEPTATRPPGAGATATPSAPAEAPEPVRTLSPPPAPPAPAPTESARTVQIAPAGGIVPAGYRLTTAPTPTPVPVQDSMSVPARSSAATPAPTSAPTATATARPDDGSPWPAPTVTVTVTAAPTVTVTATATVTVTARPEGNGPPTIPTGPSAGPGEHPGPTASPTRPTGTAVPTARPTATACPTPRPSASTGTGTDRGTSPNRNTGQDTRQGPQQSGGTGRGALTVEQAEARVKEARAELTDATKELAGVRIVAPVDGTVMSVAGAVGDRVGTGTFLTLGNLDELQVEALFTESDIGSLKPGQQAAITLATRQGEKYTGTVTGIAPTPTTSDRLVRYGVTIAFDAPPPNLLVGQTASVTVTVAESAETLYVPAQAVRTRDGVSRVTVRGGAERVVETGVRSDRYVEITSGLSENDQVILPGAAEGEFPDSGWPEADVPR